MTAEKKAELERAIHEYAALRVHANDILYGTPEYAQVIDQQVAVMERISEMLNALVAA